MKNRILNSTLLLLFTILILPSVSFAKKKMHPDLKWSVQQLKSKKMNNAFINTVRKNYDKKSFERVIRLNILGFLSPSNHMALISDKAVEKSLGFLQRNQSTFDYVQDEYAVPPEIITSLLWIETRHGNITGTFHVPSVYMHLLQLSRKKNQNELYKIARKNPVGRAMSSKELRKKIKERADRRAKWALEELTALEKIFLAKQKDLKKLKGSFAGAFGLPQFIPSSYRDFASSSHDRAPDLFTIEDSIKSVARYLTLHGWNNLDENQQIDSLMKYNNSRDYAESIIELSKKVRTLMNESRDKTAAKDTEGTI